ncbi:MAG: bifunctional phosphoribosylaminoimidazolecarboxamide formyltransferase/IMP cyclohydrolase [Planctomycetota bacterium]|nr:bifunctional phosphoribosylaminoimidazolecarboxamide formyltransferase/IMP cyclohydrolase [Planctomycetota bacterium]
MSDPVIERALISVSDKKGVAEIARVLHERKIEILSTGGTKRYLEEASINVTDIASYTEFPEMMSGRLKTLHPRVHGGILCRHDRSEELESMQAQGILKIPLVIVNLYPFEETISREDADLAIAIENIDIGGPTMIRAAAKNYRFTTVVTSPEQYAEVAEQIQKQGATSLTLRKKLALDAFKKTASYDRAIANYLVEQNFSTSESRFMQQDETPLPEKIELSLTRKLQLRYGENPHQQAALYQRNNPEPDSLVTAKKLNGKELSFNNLLDLESALQLVKLLPEPSAVVMKHNNPCGASSQSTLKQAAENAFAGDPESAFGSVLGFNVEVDGETAEFLVGPDKFVEAIIAPSFRPEAIEILTTRPKWKNNVRLMQTGPFQPRQVAEDLRSISGGILIQDADNCIDQDTNWKVVTENAPSTGVMEDLQFAWTIVRQVKSNAIVVAKGKTLWGSGAGQMSRIDAVEIALQKASEMAANSVLASDAFFPFADSIAQAQKAGIQAIIQPGGSRRDEEVIAACNTHKIPMIFTGTRHFKH